MDDKRNQESRHDYLSFITNIVILIFVVVNGGLLTYMAFTLYQARMDAIHDERFDEAPPNEAILQRAEDAVNQADQLLGFLEGAAVLIALALGAGALVGYRNTREIRADLRQEQDELRKRSEDIRKEQENRSERIDKLLNEGNKLYGEMQQYLPQLENATNLVSEIENIRRQINDQVQQELLKAQNNANALIQATQQLNLKNYEEAYIYTLRVLENMPSNSQALYVAGWLEMQYIPGKLELSIEHLNKAIEQDKDNATYQAALGVAMKRAGQNAAKAGDLDKRNHDYWEAEQLLKSALDRSPNLIDLNRESFWGPLGGIYRDQNKLKKAITAYERALDVTPGSSYPLGNLATLYLQQATNPESQITIEKAVIAYRHTQELSRMELAFNPNDYFLMMDVAMSSTMLGHGDDEESAEKREEAIRWLKFALQRDPTVAMLGLSLENGWKRLQKFCPKEWTDVHDVLQEAIEIVEAAFNDARAADERAKAEAEQKAQDEAGDEDPHQPADD